jgi:hypothetical protein
MAEKLLAILTVLVVLSILEAVTAVLLNFKPVPLKQRTIRGLFDSTFGYIIAVIWWLG